MHTQRQSRAKGWGLRRRLALKAPFFLCACGLWLCAGSPVHAEPLQENRDLFGGVGLVDMPSARMATDGEMDVSASFFQNTQHYSLNFQLLPWLETSFRYSGLRHFDPNPTYYDRSFATKIRLWDEAGIWPAVSVGINDLVGTGIYSGEYIAASKQFGPVDTTIGIGWGRLGTANTFRNPFAAFSKSFETRSSSVLQIGGQFNFQQYFHGPTSGLFGGVNWQTPLPNLMLSAEYSSDAYTLEASRGQFTPRSQFNIGASYLVADTVSLGAAYLYGRSVAVSINFHMDPSHSFPAPLPPPPLDPVIRTSAQQALALQTAAGLRRRPAYPSRPSANNAAFVDGLFNMHGVTNVQIVERALVVTLDGSTPASRCHEIATFMQGYRTELSALQVQSKAGFERCVVPATLMEGPSTAPMIADPSGPAFPVSRDEAANLLRVSAARQHIQVQAIRFSGTDAIVYYTNSRYFSEPEAIGRLTRILMAVSPIGIEQFRFIATSEGEAQQEFDVLRGPAERAFLQDATGTEMFDSAIDQTPPALSNPVLSQDLHRAWPYLTWGITPGFRQNLFDITNPFQVQFLAAANATLHMLPGLTLNGEVEANLYDNFNTNVVPLSSLPHVRTDGIEYFREGKNGISDLELDYRFRPARTVWAVVKAGYLESMFAGAGGEVLWRPQNDRWAIGIDGYEVWQRAYDRLFRLQDYHVFTGHVTGYYQSPWYGLDFAVSAGQYLAGDRGMTLQVTRRFESGVEIGAFATKTNVSAAQFGEGSFDKGLIIRLPLRWILPIDTQTQLSIDLRPIQRDGGQRLYGDATLFEETRRTSQAEVRLHLTDFALQ